MGRRIKPNKPLTQQAEVVEDPSLGNANEQAVEVVEPELNMNESKKDLAETCARMEKSLAQTAKEKEQLEEKVCQLLEKIKTLEEAKSNAASNDEDAAKLKKCEQRCAELEKENASLKNENDSYLMKISELTFDNANITSQLNELEKKLGEPVQNQQANTGNGLARPYKDAFNPYFQNGYSDWK